MTDDIGDVLIEPARRSVLERVSVVWAIPLLALLIALGVAWQSYATRGPVITISFQDGAGIAANTTELRYRDITVGLVEQVRFSDDLETVDVTVRLDQKIAPYVDAGSSFWVVRPKVTARGVTGLDTVLNGVFIEGIWDTEIGQPRTTFRGLADAPLFRPGQNGIQIALRTTANGQLTDNAPILFRGIEVGRIGNASIAPEGSYAIADAIIYAPHDRLITKTTRFWDASGFRVSVGASGAEIDFSSLASLVGGGIVFDTFVSGGERVSDGTVFSIYEDEETARNTIFSASAVERLRLSVIFDDNIAGLSVESPVELSGLRIGSVDSISGIVDPEMFGDQRARLNAVIAIQPAQLGLPGEVSPEAALDFLTRLVGEGLRARLATANLLTGGLKVELVMVAEEPGGTMRMLPQGLPVVPTTLNAVSGAGATVEGVLQRINDLPVEELLGSAIGFLNSAQTLLADEDLRDAPGDVRALLGDVRGFVASPDLQDIPTSLNAALMRIEAILGQLETEQTVSRMLAALDSARAAATQVGDAVDGVPDLVAQLTAVAARAESLPLDELTRDVSALVRSAEAVVGTEAARDLPDSLNSALSQMNDALSELREGGAINNANRTLSAAREAADAVALSTADLPDLVQRLSRVLDQASATIAGYDKGEMLSREVQTAMRDIQDAADAIAALARTLERNPSALIRGR